MSDSQNLSVDGMQGDNLMADNSITTSELEKQAQELVAQANDVLNQQQTQTENSE
jgi:predicted ATP-grasp superfamily ATP-dependent carboligase